MRILKKIPFLVLVAVIVALIGFVSYQIASAVMTQPQSATKATNTPTEKAEKEEAEKAGATLPPTFGVIIAFVLLAGIIVWIILSTYKERRGTGTNASWKDILSQPVFISIAGLFVLNPLASLFAYPEWKWFWDHQILFWGTNMALVIFVHFQQKKEKYAKFVAGGIGLLILSGFINEIHKNHSGQPSQTGLVQSNGYSSISSLPADLVLHEICMCESGCKQFEPDGKTPLKNKGNPAKNIKPSSAFGKYQFLESHRGPAKKLNFDLDTEKGQDDYARYRYSQTGTKDWEYDENTGGGRACWGPKLAALVGEPTKLPRKLASVLASPDKWSEKVYNPFIQGTNLVWGRFDKTKGGKCEVMLNGDLKKIFATTEPHYEFSPEIMQFRCAEEVEMNVYLVPKT